MDGRLGLSHAHGLDEDNVIAGGLAQKDGLAGLAGHTAQRAGRRTGTDERHGIVAESLHTGLVSKDTALGLLAAWIYGQYGQAVPLCCYQIAECLYESTLAGPGHTGDADTHGLLALGVLQAADYQFVRHIPMLGQGTLHQSDGLTEHYGVALYDTFHVVVHRHDRAAFANDIAEVRIDYRRLFYPFVHHQGRVVMMILIEEVSLSVGFIVHGLIILRYILQID